jgi:hypothetical protein
MAFKSLGKRRLRDSIWTASMIQRVILGLALALVTLLAARGIEIHISDIFVRIGR